MQLRYEVIIYWSADDQAFIAEAPELPGCMADGKTHREALDNLEVIMGSGLKPLRSWDVPFRSRGAA